MKLLTSHVKKRKVTCEGKLGLIWLQVRLISFRLLHPTNTIRSCEILEFFPEDSGHTLQQNCKFSIFFLILSYSYYFLLITHTHTHTKPLQKTPNQNIVHQSTLVQQKIPSGDQKIISRNPVHTLLPWYIREYKTTSTAICAGYFTYCRWREWELFWTSCSFCLRLYFPQVPLNFPFWTEYPSLSHFKSTVVISSLN